MITETVVVRGNKCHAPLIHEATTEAPAVDKIPKVY